jgi:hypothetical protein
MQSSHEVFCHVKPYIQPFERTLAELELAAVAGAAPIPQAHDGAESVTYVVETRCSVDHLADRLTYWERVHENGDSSVARLTRQVLREATAHLARNGLRPDRVQAVAPFVEDLPLPNHRALRYGPHGIHEYRGKFFPQLVRALLNIAAVGPRSIILDPMCGSGTTPVEAILLGCRAVAVDVNPLSLLMTRAKCDILSTPPDRLTAEYQSLRNDLLALPRRGAAPLLWLHHLPPDDQVYLSRWFAPEVLAQCDPIAVRVHDTSHPACRALFLASLSNILRRISWQKNDDLRVRKEVQSENEIDVMNEFLAELGRSVTDILAFMYEDGQFDLQRACISAGDARCADLLLAGLGGRVDAIVTSPPYATALPYIDTDRLSLSYLGLLPRPQHRRREQRMIGNREITKKHRLRYWEEYERHRHELPERIVTLVDQIEELNRDADVGFRRRNLPALLSHYFLDMRKVFRTFLGLLRSGAPAYVVVGNNHTVAGGRRIDIETQELLAELGQSVGLVLQDTVEMDMLTSRDIFRKNTGSSETILMFRNP